MAIQRTRCASFVLALVVVGCGGATGPDTGGSRSRLEPGDGFDTIGQVERLDPALDSLIPEDAVIEVLADGFDWSEGPVWVEQGS
jgi:hypothetical protein